MALNLALSVLVSRCRQRARRENDDSISPAEWKSLIHEVYGELHALPAEMGSRYFITEATITATGAASYNLPADHRETYGIDRVLDGAGRRNPLVEVMHRERTLLIGRTGDAAWYEVFGTTIVLYPNPSSGSYKHIYAPHPTDLSAAADTTTVDVMTTDGLAFLLWGVAVLARDKEESDQMAAIKHRDDAKERLQFWVAQHRSVMQPRLSTPGTESVSMIDPDPTASRYPP